MTWGKPNPYAIECYNELQTRAAKIEQLQARLDAIAAIAAHCKRMGWMPAHANDAEVLARGTPARELKAALKRWAPRKERK